MEIYTYFEMVQLKIVKETFIQLSLRILNNKLGIDKSDRMKLMTLQILFEYAEFS